MNVRLILLAAGLSRRFGAEDKLLHFWEGKPLYRHTLDKLTTLGYPVTVVANAPEIGQYCRSRGVDCVPSPDAALGVAHSLRAGLTASSGADVYVCFVADQPKLKEAEVRGFLAACLHGKALLGCVSADGVWGNPVWFDKAFLPELMALEGDTGGKAVLHRHRELVFAYEVAQESLMDVDTPLVIDKNIR